MIMDKAYLIGQFCGLLTIACSLIMPFLKKKWQLLWANIAINGLVIANLILIDQLGSACYLCVVAIIQSLLALLRIKNEKPVSKAETILFTIAYVGFGFFGIVTAPGFVPAINYRNLLELLPILGALALMFPFLYNLVDVVSIVATSITVSEETEVAIPDIDFFFFESLGFFVVAISLWLYMLVVKKYKYNPFRKKELIRCGAATGETLGAMAYIFAVGINPILTVPITSAYCLVTIVLARIFLKEKLTRKQYFSLALLVVGIVLLGISGIVSA